MTRIPRVAVLFCAVALMSACQAATPSASPGTSPAASVAAPSSGGAASPSSEATAAAAGGGGNLVVATQFEPDNLYAGPFSVSSKYSVISRNIFESLVGRNSETAELEPQLAESWTNPEPNKWVFQLREGVTFHDGTPFNAQTAAESLTGMYFAENPEVGSFVGQAATFAATGDYTLEMTTAGPDPIVPERMSFIPVAAPSQLEKEKGASGASPSAAPDASITPVGTGPYEFVKWNKGTNMELKLYPGYWRSKPGMFDTVDWQFRVEPSVRGQMIQTGEADATNGLTGDQCDSGAVTCRLQPTTSTYILRMDQFNQTMLGDKRIRQAIATAIDRKSIADTFLSGSAVSNNPIPPGSIGYDETLDRYGFDLAAAKALVEEAKADGVDTSLPIKIKYVATLKPDDSIAAVVYSNLRDLGLNVSPAEAIGLDVVGPAFAWTDGRTLQKDMPKDRGEIWLTGTGNELLDMSVTAGIFLKCDAVVSTYCNPAVDAAYDKAVVLGGDERHEAFKEMWRLAYEDVALLPIAPTSGNWAFSDRINVPTRIDGVLPLWEVQTP